MTILLPHHAATPYGLSLLTVVTALLITESVIQLNGRTPLYFVAIIAMTWFFGRNVGLFSFSIATLAAWYFTIPPRMSFYLDSNEAIQILSFIPVTLAILLLISTLKSRTESLSKSEALYRTLFEYAPEGILISDDRSYFLDANASICRMLGYRREELIGLHASDILNSEEAPEIDEALEVIHANRDFKHEFQFLRKDGTLFPAEVIATKMPDGNLLGVIRDLSERDQADRRFKQIIEHAPYGNILVDEDGIVQLVNGEIERLFQYERTELLGKNIELLVPDKLRHAHHDFREGYMTGPAPRAMGSGRELFGRRKDGAAIPVEIALNPLRTENGIMILGTVVDLTPRKAVEEALRESEKQLAGIINSAMDAIITIDDRQRIVLFNAAAERMFAIDATVVIDQPIENLIPERFRSVHRSHVENFGKTMVTKRAMGPLGVLYGLRSNGEEFPIEASISQIESSGTRLYTVILRDITERRHSEAAIVQLNENLERSVLKRTRELADVNSELEAFSYSVSHDLRAPLRHIDGFVQLLTRREAENFDETSLRYIRTIEKAVGKMGILIDELLSFSRTSRQDVNLRSVDLNVIIQEARTILADNIDGRKISWKIAKLPRVLGDPTLLNVVIINLLSNAIKYTRGREEAMIDIGSTNEDENNLTFFVKDNGAGFDMAYADKLFGVFQRLHREEEFEGIGIGLATVYRIVRRHGGSIRAEGAIDQGATFFVTLKREVSSDHEPAEDTFGRG